MSQLLTIYTQNRGIINFIIAINFIFQCTHCQVHTSTPLLMQHQYHMLPQPTTMLQPIAMQLPLPMLPLHIAMLHPPILTQLLRIVTLPQCHIPMLPQLLIQLH